MAHDTCHLSIPHNYSHDRYSNSYCHYHCTSNSFASYITTNTESPQGFHLRVVGAEAQVLPQVLRRRPLFDFESEGHPAIYLLSSQYPVLTAAFTRTFTDSHMRPTTAVNAAQQEIVNLLRTL